LCHCLFLDGILEPIIDFWQIPPGKLLAASFRQAYPLHSGLPVAAAVLHPLSLDYGIPSSKL
jgi:hypothetical protein